MKTRAPFVVALAAVFTAAAIPACGGSDNPNTPAAGGSAGDASVGGSTGQAGQGGATDSGKPPGTEGGPCYGNGTCNAGLTCLSNLCVNAGKGGSGGTGDASVGGSGGSAGKGGTGGIAGTGGAAGDGGPAGSGGSAGSDSGLEASPGGSGGAAGDAGPAGSGGASGDDGGTSGSGGWGGVAGSAGQGGLAGQDAGEDVSTGGTGGTVQDAASEDATGSPCPADCSGNGTCDSGAGTCLCWFPYAGTSCDQCVSGFYGYPACHPPTPCPADCSGNGTCDHSNGVCSCNTGYQLPACGQCASGYTGYPACYLPVPCPGGCSGHGTCNDKTGTCACDVGYQPPDCGQCATGYTGYPNCQEKCPLDNLKDFDGDGICGNVDNCPGIANPGQQDSNSDGIGDACSPSCAQTPAPLPINCSAWTRTEVLPHIVSQSWLPTFVPDGWSASQSEHWAIAAHYDRGIIYHKTGGNSWNWEVIDTNVRRFDSIFGFGSTDVLVFGTNMDTSPYDTPVFWRWNGSTWASVTDLPSLPQRNLSCQAWAGGPQDWHLLCVTYKSAYTDPYPAAFHWDGSTWAQTPIQLPALGPNKVPSIQIRRMWGSGPNDVYGVGYIQTGGTYYDREVLVMHFDGQIWSRLPFGQFPGEYDDIHGTGACDISIVGRKDDPTEMTFGQYLARRFADGSWEELVGPPSPQLNMLAHCRHVFSLGPKRAVLQCTNGGQDFTVYLVTWVGAQFTNHGYWWYDSGPPPTWTTYDVALWKIPGTDTLLGSEPYGQTGYRTCQ